MIFQIPVLITLSSLVFSTTAQASGPKEFERISSKTHYFQTQRGSSVPMLAQIVMNEHAQREVVVTDELIKDVSNETEATLLYGRDTDQNDLPDTWFLMGVGGVISTHYMPASEEDGWDQAAIILKNNEAKLKERNLVTVWFQWLARLSAGKAALLKIERTQMDLHEIEMRTDRMAALDPSNQVVRENYAMLSEAWSVMSEDFTSKIRWRIGEIIVSTAITLEGGLIAKLFKPVLTRIGVTVSESSIGTLFGNVYKKYFQRVVTKAKESAHRIAMKNPAPSISGAVHLTAKNLSSHMKTVIKNLEARDRFSHALGVGIKQSWYLGRSAMKKKSYVVQVQLIQLAIELFARRKVLFDLDPITMPERVASTKELIQNIGFMTTETFVGSGIAVLNRHSMAKRMIIAGVFSTMDSAFWSFAVKQTNDTLRVGMDTAWEVFFGNAQTTIIDPLSIGTGTMLAHKFNNPNLRIVGWALTYLDQAAGYFVYNKATEKGLPILQEKAEKYAKNHKAKGQSPEDDMPNLYLVPIYAP